MSQHRHGIICESDYVWMERKSKIKNKKIHRAKLVSWSWKWHISRMSKFVICSRRMFNLICIFSILFLFVFISLIITTVVENYRWKMFGVRAKQFTQAIMQRNQQPFNLYLNRIIAKNNDKSKKKTLSWRH